MIDLPYQLGDVHKIIVHRSNDIYVISTKGFVRGFNPVKKICYTPVSINLASLV